MFCHKISIRLTIFLALLVCGGCRAEHEKPTVKVTGVVRLEGNPVTEGYVIFAPIPGANANPLNSGKTALGQIKPDGTFTLTTYHEGDGAIAGPHKVSFFKPDPVDDEQIVKDRYLPGGKELQVEVQGKSNYFQVDLYTNQEPVILHSPI